MCVLEADGVDVVAVNVGCCVACPAVTCSQLDSVNSAVSACLCPLSQCAACDPSSLSLLLSCDCLFGSTEDVLGGLGDLLAPNVLC